MPRYESGEPDPQLRSSLHKVVGRAVGRHEEGLDREVIRLREFLRSLPAATAGEIVRELNQFQKDFKKNPQRAAEALRAKLEVLGFVLRGVDESASPSDEYSDPGPLQYRLGVVAGELRGVSPEKLERES